MKVTRSQLKKIIIETISNLSETGQGGYTPDRTPLGADRLGVQKLGLYPNGYEDPNIPPANSDPESVFKAVEMASRILEDMPLEDLPEEVNQAAANLRSALEKMS
tara:strand:- start:715 stop:1029 length:315 start_codon:yes stop_codon:yes gene_type:complete